MQSANRQVKHTARGKERVRDIWGEREREREVGKGMCGLKANPRHVLEVSYKCGKTNAKTTKTTAKTKTNKNQQL